MQFRTLATLAALAIGGTAAPLAFAAAPVGLDDTAPADGSGASAPVLEGQLDVEMTVKNWVLCVSQSLAEQLVHAREQSVEDAQKAYTTLAAARSCGKFAEMRVILQTSIYHTSPDASYAAQIYGAKVNIAGSWANAFVVHGSLPGE